MLAEWNRSAQCIAVIERWEEIGSSIGYTCRWFQVKETRLRSPRNRIEETFYSLLHHDCVNIIALTPEHKLVMVRQYRYTIDTVSLETPGGVIDRTDASPVAAARRELKEETGYISNEWHPLGRFHANPAVMESCCHVFLALDAVSHTTQNLDATEDLEIEIVSPYTIPDRIAAGEISHGIVLSSLFLFESFKLAHPSRFQSRT